MISYEVSVTWLPKEFVEIAKAMRAYDVWSYPEIDRRGERSKVVSTFTLTGDKPMTKDVANQARDKYKAQWSADGHEVRDVEFKRLEDL